MTRGTHREVARIVKLAREVRTRSSPAKLLMVRYQEGDIVAARELIDRLSPQLHRLFMGQFASRESADDLLQETWLWIHRVRHTYRAGELRVRRSRIARGPANSRLATGPVGIRKSSAAAAHSGKRQCCELGAIAGKKGVK